ncbi:DUF397 domain-containing protein [Kitasatospora sp. A2-31]|uniref:DUF397 domain-containing protein n=1 Tax=Kitasatospora sp. A2-31 TaxID=2916414 RepID=UPI001EEB8342|nr:DUF397 domain-containing protein [Kitasatospora sp. A2-31]MCG6497304.1 DUF397 domain-containing protein [Kitasatospora sp. A2-31]
MHRVEQWRKSSYSSGNESNDCIEVDDARPGSVRDSKDPEGPRLRFTPAAWQAFVTATARQEFSDASN